MKQEFIIEGTTCKSCEKIVIRQTKKVKGVIDVTFSYAKETGTVTFDESKTDIDEILSSIEEKGYSGYIVEDSRKNYGWMFGIAGLLVIGFFLFRIADGFQMPQITQSMGYGLLFIVGLITGFHCIAMCGGFVVSYTAKNATAGRTSHKSHLYYGVGKMLSYTIIGAAFGLLGSIIAFTPMMRGYAGIFAGIFLLLFGLKMLNVFPFLRKFSIKTPGFVSKLLKKESSPFIIGLLNGLMIACGPLQAIYIMAAGTGSMIEGGKLLLIFAAGTLPIMLGFGYFASYVSSKLTQRLLKASGAIVMILGLIMVNNGLVLTGAGYDISSITSKEVPEAPPLALKDGVQEIRMDVTHSGWSPDTFVLKKDVPVKWIINGKEITGCNNAIQVPKYGLEFDVDQGEQVIEFTPTEEGVVRWSCWMGMIPGTFIVKDDIDTTDVQAVQQEIEKVPVQSGSTCGGGGSCGGSCGGGCGCGG